MKKIFFRTAMAFSILLFILMLAGCGRNKISAETDDPVSVSTAEPAELPESEADSDEKLSNEQALSAIKSYCFISNPSLNEIVDAEEYPVYWEIISSDEYETVVLFRSYTGAQNRYHIDRVTGDVYVTEFVPGITLEEQRTNESFNARDYLSED